MIAPRTAIRRRPHRVLLQGPAGPPAADGDGSYTQAWVDLVPPAMDAEIVEATQAALERLVSNTVVSTATHLVSLPYHAQITTQSRVVYNGRIFAVTGVNDLEQRHAELVLECAEAVA